MFNTFFFENDIFSCIMYMKEVSMNKSLCMVLYILSIIIMIIGIIMTVFSSIVILPSISSSNIIIPLAFLILTIIGILMMRYYKKKMK